MRYTVTAVDDHVDTYQTKYGDMKGYHVRFAETGETVVSLSQKPETAPPRVGDTMDGSVDLSAQYGPKFKKEYAPRPTISKGVSGADPHAMYVAYAKDLTVALIASLVEPSSEKFKTEFEQALGYVVKGAKVLEGSKE